MGFRNPLRTAAAVDTGQPAGAGVRVLQTSTPTGTVGAVEFRDGIVGDTPSRLTSTANLVPQGGGYTAQGGKFSMEAGSFNGVTGPRLDLAVESAPSGGYRSAARISQGFEPIAFGYPTWKPGWRDFPGANGFERPRFTLLADGSVLFAGILQNVTGSSQGGVGSDVVIGSIPAGFIPPVTCLLDGIGQSGVRYRVDVAPDGSIHMGDSPALVGAGYLNVRGLYRLDATPT